MSENRPQEPDAAPSSSEEEDLDELDHVDPLKRDPDGANALPGLDPIVPPVPPES